MRKAENKLYEFFKTNNRAAIAFSGGVDSVYLLYAASKAGADVTAYYVKSVFQPEFELEDAKNIAKQLGAKMKIIAADVLSDEKIRSNPADRCYYCKNRIFSAILKAAHADGYNTILDGTNASDSSNDRPGMKALEEMKVLSPLRLAGLTKDMIRELSREADLFTWNKPAYACLATRIEAGCEITKEKLEKTERAEAYMHRIGFSDFRVRMSGETAKLQIKEEQLPLVVEKRNEILSELGKYYKGVMLDLEVRQ